jgi:hypothetical protein
MRQPVAALVFRAAWLGRIRPSSGSFPSNRRAGSRALDGCTPRAFTPACILRLPRVGHRGVALPRNPPGAPTHRASIAPSRTGVGMAPPFAAQPWLAKLLCASAGGLSSKQNVVFTNDK